jgi:hypothetical protein
MKLCIRFEDEQADVFPGAQKSLRCLVLLLEKVGGSILTFEDINYVSTSKILKLSTIRLRRAH